jgi:3-phosphoshikimate 1-carboxyvinyltransferase
MNVHVFPTSTLKGSVVLPSSKSYSVRAFLTAACGGRSRIIHPSDCDDVLAAVSVAKQLGARIVRRGDAWDVTAGAGREDLRLINVNESGTVLRMILPLVALKNKQAVVNGRGTLKGRPNHHLIRVLRDMGACVYGWGEGQSIPIIFQGGRLRGGILSIDGSLSSQFVSALLMACPQMEENSEIHLLGKKVVSEDYVMMTIQILVQAGIAVKRMNNRTYKVSGGQVYQGLKQFRVPSDYGLAAFLLAAAAMTDSDVILKGFFNDTLIQADAHILPILKKMGCVFSKTSRSIRFKGPARLKGGTFSLKNCPDLLPILSVLALFAGQPVKFTDIAHVRVKESDRISDLRQELIKTGARIDEGQDFIKVYPINETECKHNLILDSHHDHRLAMAFSVLGLKIGVKVKGIECVAKSYPGFLKDFQRLGAKTSKEY